MTPAPPPVKGPLEKSRGSFLWCYYIISTLTLVCSKKEWGGGVLWLKRRRKSVVLAILEQGLVSIAIINTCYGKEGNGAKATLKLFANIPIA